MLAQCWETASPWFQPKHKPYVFMPLSYALIKIKTGTIGFIYFSSKLFILNRLTQPETKSFF